MSAYFTKLLFYFGNIFICSVVLLLVVYGLNRKWPNKFFYYSNKILGFLLAASFFILILNSFFYILAITVGIVFSIFDKLFYNIFNSPNVAKYLALVVTLIILAYTPEQIGFWFFRIFDKIGKNKYDFAGKYRGFIKFMRPKLWIYFFALVITLLSSIETFFNREIISFAYWIGFKSVVLQSVVTFIAFDRFLKLLIDEWISIKKDISNIHKTVIGTKELENNE